MTSISWNTHCLDFEKNKIHKFVYKEIPGRIPDSINNDDGLRLDNLCLSSCWTPCNDEDTVDGGAK